jgi:hypothetical protein
MIGGSCQRGSFAVEALLVFTACLLIVAGGVRMFCELYDRACLESLAWQAADQAARDWNRGKTGLYADERAMLTGTLVYQEVFSKAETVQGIRRPGPDDMPDWLSDVRETVRARSADLLLSEDIRWTLTREEHILSGSVTAEFEKDGWLKAGARGVVFTQTPVGLIRKVDLILEQGGSLLRILSEEVPFFQSL